MVDFEKRETPRVAISVVELSTFSTDRDISRVKLVPLSPLEIANRRRSLVPPSVGPPSQVLWWVVV